MKAYAHIDGLEQMQHQRAWLLRVLYHTFIDARRSDLRSPTHIGQSIDHDGEQSLAARFAAKLAARQLLAEDSGRSARLCDIEVVRRKSGEPEIEVRGRPGTRLLVSLTHDRELAVASVWIERPAPDDPVSGAT